MPRPKYILAFSFLFFCLQASADKYYDLAYRLSGSAAMLMPDGKVDQWTQRPAFGAQAAVELLPTGKWRSLQQWNNSSVGFGVSYINLGNDKILGSAFTAYAYMNQHIYNGRHFRFGVRPTVGIALVNKTYSNTLPDEYPPYSIAQKDGKLVANWSIGSILNAYLAMEMYMDFPVRDGWEITMAGGWHHISNGSVMHPNAGYNLFGGELGVRYHPTVPYAQEQPRAETPHRLYDGVDKPWAVEISATGGMKQNYYKDNMNGQLFYGVAVLKVSAFWVPLSFFRFGVGADAFYDGYYASVNDEFAALNPGAPVTYFGKTYLRESKVENCFRAGVSLQPEFTVGHLTAGIHVGVYLYDPVKNLEPYDEARKAHDAGTTLNRGIFYSYDFTKASNYQDGWCYMQFLLKYRFLQNLFVQVGLKTHGVRAEFIDAGLGVAF